MAYYISNFEVQANSSSLLSASPANLLESPGETTPKAQHCAVPRETAGETTPKAQNLPTNYAGSPPVLPNNYSPLDMLSLTPLSTPQLPQFPTVSPLPPSFVSPSSAQPASSGFLPPHSDASASLFSSSPAPVNHLTASAFEHSPSPASALGIADKGDQIPFAVSIHLPDKLSGRLNRYIVFQEWSEAANVAFRFF